MTTKPDDPFPQCPIPPSASPLHGVHISRISIESIYTGYSFIVYIELTSPPPKYYNYLDGWYNRSFKGNNMTETYLQKLLPRHHKIIDLFLDGNLTIKQIAEAVSMTPVAIHNIRSSPTFQHELSLRKLNRDKVLDDIAAIDRTAEIIDSHTEDAAEKIVTLLSSRDESIALRSASELLDRGGFPKASKIESVVKGAVVVMSAEDLTRIERTLELENDRREMIAKEIVSRETGQE